jgi:thiamine-monophosphate kinase
MTVETDLIARHFAPLAGEGAFGLRDDAAMLSPTAGHDLVITVDALVAGVHFFANDPPASIARKALGVNLSDLAAKGASPRGFVLTLALSGQPQDDWLSAFATGLGQAAAEWNCPLLGGDTTMTPGPLTLSITAFGEVPAGQMVRRAGARAGDMIAVTGTIGDAALGLVLQNEPERPAWAALAAKPRTYLIDRYRHPRPRIALMDALRIHATAAMDISDGLLGDVAKLLATSGVCGEIDVASVPLSDAARAAISADQTLRYSALTGGDDYELVITLPESAWAIFHEKAQKVGIGITCIGIVKNGSELTFHDGKHPFLLPKQLSYQHFSD